MIPVHQYTAVYYMILTVITVITIAPLSVKKELDSFPEINRKFGTFLVLFVVIAFIGLRDPWGDSMFFGDTISYTRFFYRLQSEVNLNISKDVGFYVFMRLCSYLMNITMFYFLCALIYVLLPYYAFRKWFGKNAIFALLLFIGSMSFWAYGINGVRNGLATSIFIFALSFKNRKYFFGLMILAMSFHTSMILPFFAYILSTIYPKTKVWLTFWLLSIVFSFYFGDSTEYYISYVLQSLGIIETYRIENLFSDRFDVTTRAFRIDFILYSLVPIVVGYWYIFKRKFSDRLYNVIFNTYLIANTIWIVMIYAAFTNRIAYLSWFLYPIILCYPLLDKNNHVINEGNKTIILNIMLVVSLLFTMLMEFK